MTQAAAWPERASDQITNQTPGRARHTVLLVDSDFLMRGVLAEVLADHGFATLAAASAGEAMALLDGGATVDLVFSALEGPDSGGAGLAHWIARRRPGLALLPASDCHGARPRNGASVARQGEHAHLPCAFDRIVACIRAAIAHHQGE